MIEPMIFTVLPWNFTVQSTLKFHHEILQWNPVKSCEILGQDRPPNGLCPWPTSTCRAWRARCDAGRGCCAGRRGGGRWKSWMPCSVADMERILEVGEFIRKKTGEWNDLTVGQTLEELKKSWIYKYSYLQAINGVLTGIWTWFNRTKWWTKQIWTNQNGGVNQGKRCWTVGEGLVKVWLPSQLGSIRYGRWCTDYLEPWMRLMYVHERELSFPFHQISSAYMRIMVEFPEKNNPKTIWNWL